MWRLIHVSRQGMKLTTKRAIIILVVLILAAAAGAYHLYRMANGAKFLIIMNRLDQASADLKRRGTFTNDVPEFCDIYKFTEHYTIRGSDYQCTLAAKSSVFRGRGFMAIATNDVILWVDKERGAIPMTGPDSVGF